MGALQPEVFPSVLDSANQTLISLAKFARIFGIPPISGTSQKYARYFAGHHSGGVLEKRRRY